jgi:hypothetical protein
MAKLNWPSSCYQGSVAMAAQRLQLKLDEEKKMKKRVLFLSTVGLPQGSYTRSESTGAKMGQRTNNQTISNLREIREP